jgi:hypothetical protein
MSFGQALPPSLTAAWRALRAAFFLGSSDFFLDSDERESFE